MNEHIEMYLKRLSNKYNILNQKNFNDITENFNDISEKEIMLLILYKLELIECFMINYL